MTSLAYKEKQKVENYINEINSIIQEAQKSDVQFLIYKKAAFIKELELQRDEEFDELDFFRDDVKEKLGNFLGNIAYQVVDKLGDFADIKPYKTIDDDIIDKLALLVEEFERNYLPDKLDDIIFKINTDIKVFSTDENYVKILLEIKDKISSLKDALDKDKKLLTYVQSMNFKLHKLNLTIAKHMMKKITGDEVKEKVKKINNIYDKLCKKAGKYQKRVMNIELIDINSKSYS